MNMKNKLIGFINQPRKVAFIIGGLGLVFILGGYFLIQKNRSNYLPVKIDTQDIVRNNSVTLGFLSSGRIANVFVKTGDKVTAGQTLAALDSGNASGALAQAEANYQKIINGATSPAIEVAKAQVNTAQVNLDQAVKIQKTNVDNAYRTLLNSTPEAIADGYTTDIQVPTISGNYIGNTEGQINLTIYNTGNSTSFTVSGLADGTGTVTTTNPQPIGNSGLFIKFPTTNMNVNNWTITIPNKKATNYVSNLNNYNLALETQRQTIANLQAVLSTAKANLDSIVAKARPEDIASAKGALQIAQAAYNNTIIVAPADGVVKSVSINKGEIANANVAAIELEIK
jgi:HlyD family secretion protein